MKPNRYLFIGAHPDDPEILFGGTAARLIRHGHAVHFATTTRGDAGHHRMQAAELAQRRHQECRKVAELADLAGYDILDLPDGGLEVSLPNRALVIRLIRRIAPDVVITHRPCDYHPDHRATAQLVQDASYLVRVPLVCPDTPIPGHWPVFLSSWDHFKLPAPFAPDVCVPVDDTLDAKLEMLDCHVSQFYEWLPWIDGGGDDCGVGRLARAERHAFLSRGTLAANRLQADLYRAHLRRHHGPDADGIRHVESFQLSEYGRQANAAELAALFEIPTHPPASTPGTST